MKHILTFLLLLATSLAWGQETELTDHPPTSADTAVVSGGTSGILLFNGTGTSGDVSDWEAILRTNLSLTFDTANSAQMDAMSATTFKSYKLFIIPGGDSAKIARGLKTTTTAMIRHGVQVDDVHYLGVCAGAFMGGTDGSFNYLALTNGVGYNLKGGAILQSIHYNRASDAPIDLLFDDGPSLKGNKSAPWGNVVAQYPDNGDPGIVEGYSGAGTLGWMILISMHPDVNESFEKSTHLVFTTSIADQHAYAATIVSAALNGTSLPYYGGSPPPHAPTGLSATPH